MTTFAEILAFIKSMARINDTTRDMQLGIAINRAYRSIIADDYWPTQRTVGAPLTLTAGTQNYDLPADFERMDSESVQSYVTGQTQPYCVLDQVFMPDASLWDSFASDYAPQAFVIVDGSTAGRKAIRFLPNFTQTNLSVNFTYYANPADLAGTDVVGSPLMADVVAFKVLVFDKAITRDADPQDMAVWRAEYNDARRQARAALLP